MKICTAPGADVELIRKGTAVCRQRKGITHDSFHAEYRNCGSHTAMYINIGNDYYLLSGELRVLDHFKDKSMLPPDMIELKASTVLRCIVGETASFVDTRSYNAITDFTVSCAITASKRLYAR
jgi:hypothetical protein